MAVRYWQIVKKKQDITPVSLKFCREGQPDTYQALKFAAKGNLALTLA